MDFLDNEASESQEDVLVPSSQHKASSSQSVRPSKRRRLNTTTESEDESVSEQDDYDLPSRNQNDVEDEELGQSRSKYEDYLHVPAHVTPEKDQFVTQVEQPWSSPSAIRGPRWRKKSPTPEPDFLPLPALQERSQNQAQRTVYILSKPTSSLVDEFDDDDAEMLEAIMANEDLEVIAAHSVIPAKVNGAVPRAQTKSMRQTTLFGISTTQRSPPKGTQARAHNWPMANRDEPPTHHRINREAMKTWTYPLNVGTIRDYQFNIVQRALYHNILVALPTGLGKTFIAATVMLNFFNWTTDAQLVFVAPTKPLVTQQVEACFHIAGIPRSQTTLLTGDVQPAIRAEEWQEKRVFFMTPQTLINDLKTGMADPKKIVLLVVDEAHKATGNYAYVEVVRFLRRFNSSFRVLALTATPGAGVEAVQKVIDGLDIARVEIRTEESMDIRGFVHSRNTELEVFDNSEEIEMCLDLFAAAVQPVLNKVTRLNASFTRDPKSMTLYGLMKGREQWAHSEAGKKADWGTKGMLQACFKPLMSLAHNLELLKYHGIGPFYHKMKVFDDEAQGSGSKYTKMIVETESYRKLMNRLRSWINTEDFVGHPKLTYLNEVVLNHFMDAGSGIGFAAGRPPSDTRIMIFAHYRDSAEEIVRVLNRHEPMIRAHVFVGQSSTRGSEGMDQKTQIDIIKKFKAGTYNTLVATSIGEEGLDIGEVDLIVCYDCSKSPIRMLQRMGRTGRKRAGNIVVLLMRGKEERDYHAAKDNYLKMQEIIEKGTDFTYHDEQSRRIVPRDIQPVVDKRRVEIPIENTQAGIPEPQKRKAKNAKRPPKRFNMPDDVETGFTFLGKGSKDKSKSRKVRMPTPEPQVDLFTAELPLLQSVTLSTQQEEELERRYAQVAGSDTVYIEAVRFDTNPKELRQLSKGRLVKHSNYTKSLVKASKAMHKDRSWDRPSKSDIMTSFQITPTPEAENLIAKPRTNPIAQGPHLSDALSDDTIRRSDEINEYDQHDSFIDDEPRHKTATQQQAPPSTDPQVTDDFKPFYVPRHFSQTQASEADDDLLDITTLVAASKKIAAAKQAGVSKKAKPDKNKKRRGARKVLSDDDDEE